MVIVRIEDKGNPNKRETSEGEWMFRPSREMILRDLRDTLWRMIEPQIDSQSVATDSDKQIMRMAIKRFVDEKAESLSMYELADILDSPAHTLKVFLEYLRSKGIAGDPVVIDWAGLKQSEARRREKPHLSVQLKWWWMEG